MFRKLLKITRWSFLLGIIAGLVLLGTTPFYIYDRFNQEIPLAQLDFINQADHVWIANLSSGDFCNSTQFTILGDQFQLDAGFVKWKGLGVILGFLPRYRLDRLSGRYSDINMQNSRQGLSHNLAPDVLFDFFDENNPQGSSGWLMDTSFGSSVYQPIDPSLHYTVYATEDGLISRAETRQEFRRENGELLIEINRPCGGSPPIMESLSEGLNTLVTSALE